jgi:hypothetical protein
LHAPAAVYAAKLVRVQVALETAQFVTGPLVAVPELAVPRDGRDKYVTRLDEVCRALGAHLSGHFTGQPGAGP